MSEKVLVWPETLQGIADGIRYVNGTETEYKPHEMGEAVRALKCTFISKTLTANGTFSAADDNADGYSEITVDVEGAPVVQSLYADADGTYSPESGIAGFAPVVVATGSRSFLTITFFAEFENETWTVTGGTSAHSESFSGTVDDTLTTVVPLSILSTTYTISCNGFSMTVQTGATHSDLSATLIYYVVVPWTTGTDTQIANMVAAMDAGMLTIADTGWSIGDERSVSLSAMEATGVSESHAAQTATLVLMDSQHYELASGGMDHFVVGLKNCLNEKGYMHTIADSYGSWQSTARRTWCNNVFRAALPETIRGAFKPFLCPTGKYVSGYAPNIVSEIINTEDYFALFAEKEILNSIGNSLSAEDALTQIAYYQDSANIIKNINGTAGEWYCRSPRLPFQYCGIRADGGGTYIDATGLRGIAPFGCI